MKKRKNRKRNKNEKKSFKIGKVSVVFISSLTSVMFKVLLIECKNHPQATPTHDGVILIHGAIYNSVPVVQSTSKLGKNLCFIVSSIEIKYVPIVKVANVAIPIVFFLSEI